MNELDPDLRFIFEELTKNINFLAINLKIINNKLPFDTCNKPTKYFSHLHYKSCHLTHTRNNIALSLARRIVRIVSDNKNSRLQELKAHLLKRKHPEKIIDYSFTKLSQPRKHENNDKNVITFTRTSNPSHQFSFNKLKNCIKSTPNRKLQKAFNNKKYSLLYDNQRKQELCKYEQNLKLKQSRNYQN